AVHPGGGRRRARAAGGAAHAVRLVVPGGGGRRPPAPLPAPPPLRIVHEDAQVLAVDKPAGLAAQPTPGGVSSLLLLVSAHLGREAGLVHRLDRDTTGVMVFGKSPEATSALAASFRTGAARKQYLAGTPPGRPASGPCAPR